MTVIEGSYTELNNGRGFCKITGETQHLILCQSVTDGRTWAVSPEDVMGELYDIDTVVSELNKNAEHCDLTQVTRLMVESCTAVQKRLAPNKPAWGLHQAKAAQTKAVQ